MARSIPSVAVTVLVHPPGQFNEVGIGILSLTVSQPLANQIVAELEAALYTNRGTKRDHRRHAEPDWTAVTGN